MRFRWLLSASREPSPGEGAGAGAWRWPVPALQLRPLCTRRLRDRPPPGSGDRGPRPPACPPPARSAPPDPRPPAEVPYSPRGPPGTGAPAAPGGGRPTAGCKARGARGRAPGLPARARTSPRPPPCAGRRRRGARRRPRGRQGLRAPVPAPGRPPPATLGPRGTAAAPGPPAPLAEARRPPASEAKSRSSGKRRKASRGWVLGALGAGLVGSAPPPGAQGLQVRRGSPAAKGAGWAHGRPAPTHPLAPRARAPHAALETDSECVYPSSPTKERRLSREGAARPLFQGRRFTVADLGLFIHQPNGEHRRLCAVSKRARHLPRTPPPPPRVRATCWPLRVSAFPPVNSKSYLHPPAVVRIQWDGTGGPPCSQPGAQYLSNKWWVTRARNISVTLKVPSLVRDPTLAKKQEGINLGSLT